MFRDLPKYAEKTSNSFWSTRTPTHWAERPGLAVLKENRRKNTGLIETQVLSLSYGQVIVKPIEKQHGLVPDSYEGYQVLEPGDIVIRPTDLQNDQTSVRVGRAKDHGIITSAYIGLRSAGDWDGAYAYQYLAAIDSTKRIYGMGSGLRQQLGWADLKRMPCLVPPIEEQAAIVKYLAHANARIDKAMTTKLRLIALLEEQSVLVSRQVLSGRSIESVDLDSGDRVPWLGRTPAAWGALPLKRLAKLRGGAGFPVARQGVLNQELPFFRVSDMGYPGNEVFLDYCESTVSRDESAELGAVIFEPESICFPKVGGALLTNKRRILKRSSCLDNNLMGATFFGLEVDYAYEIMKLVDMSDVAKPGPVPAVGQGDVGRIVLPVPPKEVQHALVEALRLSQQESARAANVASREIDLLREFRTRLVADVVTGQVDVRAIAATLPDAPESFDITASATDDDLEEALREGEE